MPQPSAMALAVGMRPEDELLLCCARTCMDSVRAERIKTLLQEALDWVYLLRTARPHGMLPLLYWSLNTTYPEAVPKATLQQLRHYFYANAGHNLFLTDTLLKLLQLFEMHGIPAVPFKGPTLAALAYGNLALRESGDLDILVHRQNVLRIQELLSSQGYQPQNPLAGSQATAYLQSAYYVFVRGSGTDLVTVDLQWRMIAESFAFPLDTTCSWERLELVCLAGTTVHSLSSEDLLLVLCVHGAKHFWERLMWICDIAEMIRAHEGIDWERLIEQACRLGSRRMLALGLSLANDLLGTTLPKEVLQKIQADPVVKSLVASVHAHLFSATGVPTRGVERLSFYLQVRERLRERVLYSIDLARQTTERERWLLLLPACLSCLYYLFRPVWLIGKYGLRPLRFYEQVKVLLRRSG